MKKHNLGPTIANIRKTSGLSQKQLATKCGWGTAQFVSNIERGISFPTPKAAKVITDLGITNGCIYIHAKKALKEQIVEAIGEYNMHKARKSFGV